MDDVKALELVNQELRAQGQPPIVLPEPVRRQAYMKLQEYVHITGRPLETAIKDVVRFQLQTLELEELRSQS